MDLRTTVEQRVATVWLDRPAKRNAMTYEMWTALAEACAGFAADPQVRVLVLRSTGEHFCAGADIHHLHAARPDNQPTFMETSVAAEHALANFPKPTIAAIAGDCIGGGCSLAIDCDVRIARHDARFGITPAKLGLVYPAPSVRRALNLLGPAVTKHLLFTGDLVDARHALGIGLVNEVVDSAADLDTRVGQLASTIAQRSLLTQQAVKQMIAAAEQHGDVPDDVVQRWSDAASATDESAEGFAAFRSRRPPDFRFDGSVSSGG
jgi:enoyl-CoA hydratase/carnithine racemase